MTAAQINPARELRALIVEDEPRLRDLLCEVVPDMGFAATAARSAELAWPMIQSDPPDAIILDLQLPVMGGLELLEKVRSAGIDSAAIVLTGFGDLKSAQRAIELRVSAFLSKPFDLGDIESALSEVLRQRRAKAPATSKIVAEVGGEVLDASQLASPLTLAQYQYQAILCALSRNAGNRTAAAAELGISRRTLHHKIAQYREQGLPLD